MVIDFLPRLEAARIRAYEKKVNDLLMSHPPMYVSAIKNNFIEWYDRVFTISNSK